MSKYKLTKISDICTIRRGGSPRPIKDFIVEEGGVNWLRIGDISDGAMYVTHTSQQIKKEGMSKSTLVHPGDFILSNSMSFGRPYIMATTACIHDGWLTLQDINLEKVDPLFLYYLVSSNKIQNTFESMAAGSGVRNLNKEIVGDVVIDLPSLDRQKYIVGVLQTWDDAIKNLDDKRALVQLEKKYLLNKLLVDKK